MFILGLALLSLFTPGFAKFEKAFIVELAPSSSLPGRSLSPHSAFHKRAESTLDYMVRHEFNSPDTYLGLSIQVRSDATSEDIHAQLEAIPGVLAVSPVTEATTPITFNNTADPLLSYPEPASLRKVFGSSHPITSTLEMGGVDKLHALGIKGEGIKIGIIDTGVDYRHPSLGGGFGPGFKIAGGWSFVTDNGTVQSSPDPLAACLGGGHGTHVAGIIGMNSVPGQFDIVGVAPEATLYIYRAFNCDARAGSDAILAAMLKAQEQGVDLVSLSLSVGDQSAYGGIDPLAAVTKKLTDAGIAVIAAAGNSGVQSKYANSLYSAKWPSTEPSAISVGAIANKDFPLVYSAVDSLGATIKYASVFPIDFPDGADVFWLEDGCSSNVWEEAMKVVQDVNSTIFIFQVLAGCETPYIGNYNGAKYKPKYMMAYNAEVADLYDQCYNVPKQGYFSGSPQFTNVGFEDGVTLAQNYAAGGGYLSYKLKFPSKDFISIPQPSGGYIDYYSSFGPTYHDYRLKPQISAPGGHILSTWPLGPLSGWVIISGTSMATPYVAGAYALIKTQFPDASIQEIKERIQTTAKSLPWIYDATVLSTTAQQGAGAIDVYSAIFSKSVVSPGQITITDVSRTEYGTANLSITNKSPNAKVYTISHQGAAYSDYYLQYREVSQLAKYGVANLSESPITIASGSTETIFVSMSPPEDVTPDSFPVFSGFIQISSENEEYSIPYIGPPYSIYNTPYLTILNTSTIIPQMYGYDATGNAIRNDGFLIINPKYGFGSAISKAQWSYEARLDVLPANTSVQANHYAPNGTVSAWDGYQPSKVTPTSSIFGYESFGTLVRQRQWSTGGLSAYGKGTTAVLGDDGISREVGPGDYRWFVSVLRVGGTSGIQSDYDTWLGPVFRFVNE